jgi:phosphoribosylamine--glycine ligase
MRILVVGGGGREHALVWKIAQSPLVSKIYCAPGNAGIAKWAECVPIKPTEVTALADFAEAKRIDLTVVGPEAPLIAGIVDLFEGRGLRVFGPNADPAKLEGSKAFAKRLMQTSGIPTAAFWVCDTASVAQARVRDYYALHGPNTKLVLKADGLAAGKGVTVANSEAEAQEAVTRMMRERVFGAAGDMLVVEEYLVGEEASIMAITDGDTIVPLVPSQDHKRVFDDDLGPNTGGMGAYAPIPFAPPDLVEQTMELVLEPAIEAIAEYGIPYRGVLYAGIMMTESGVKVIEFNCRFGDPETQAVLPLLESDLVPLLMGVTDCTLDQQSIKYHSGASVTIVAASGGYPGAYETGKVISGLDVVEANGCMVFHAGTRLEQDRIVTEGGRVLSVTALGEDLMSATVRAYEGLSHLHFDGMHYRKDIASRALRKAGATR